MIECLAYTGRRYGWSSRLSSCPGCFVVRHALRQRFALYGECRDHCRQCGTQWRVRLIKASRVRCIGCRQPMPYGPRRPDDTCFDCRVDDAFGIVSASTTSKPIARDHAP